MKKSFLILISFIFYSSYLNALGISEQSDFSKASHLLVGLSVYQEEDGAHYVSPYISRSGELKFQPDQQFEKVETSDNSRTVTFQGTNGKIKLKTVPAVGRTNSLSYSFQDENAVVDNEGNRSRYTDYQLTVEFDLDGKIKDLTSCESGDRAGLTYGGEAKRKCTTVSVKICREFDQKRSLFADINRCSRIYRDVNNFYSQHVKGTQSTNVLKMISDLGDHYDQNVNFEEPMGNLANNPFGDFAQMEKNDGFCTFLKDNGLLSGGGNSTQVQGQTESSEAAN